MEVPFLDLRVKDPHLKKELLAAVDRVLSHGWLVLGPEVEALEEKLASFCQKRFAVGMGSGTDALYMALRALDVGPGDEVITTPMSWIATLNAIVLCGATPRFVDIRQDMNIDESLIRDAITPRTKVLMPVHLHGKLCQMEKICRIAQEHGVLVVEDAAQAIGAERNGKQAGSFGYVNCFSMNAMKVFGAYGDAGAVVTDDEDLREKLCSLRYAGTVNREDCHYPSLNGRLDALQAAMLLVNFQYLQERIKRRQEIARFYTESLCDVVECPESGTDHIFYTYTILVEQRDRLEEFLQARGVASRIRHPLLMTHHTAFRDLPKAHIPIAEHVVKRILSIPIHHELTQKEIEYVVSCIREFYSAGT
jgi:dTDP-4-amino-4,6-dideoxygalactose transaminase